MSDIETKARSEALSRYPDEVAKTLGGVRHGFIEGALWWAKESDKIKRAALSNRINATMKQ